MNQTPIALAARHVVSRVLPLYRRPNIGWVAFVGAGGPCTANRKRGPVRSGRLA